MEEGFQIIARSEDIPEGKGRPFVVGPHRVALVRHENRLYALDDLCPHAEASLAFGPVKDGCLLCPWHYAEFDLKTGQVMSGPATRGVQVYEVVEKEGQIWIKLPSPS